jgi:hypothetical protein
MMSSAHFGAALLLSTSVRALVSMGLIGQFYPAVIKNQEFVQVLPIVK